MLVDWLTRDGQTIREPGQQVRLRISSTYTPQVTVATKRENGTNFRLEYQVRYSDGELYRDGAWVDGRKLLDP